MRKQRYFTIKASTIVRTAYIYVSLPLVPFFLFYLRHSVGISLLIFLLAALYFAFRQKRSSGVPETVLTLSRKEMLMFSSLLLLWTYLGGQGGFWYQSYDWVARNAIYRDLITHSWPVVYESKGTALVYYFGYWLFPAALTKPILYLFGESAAWTAGKIILWGWTFFGLAIAGLLIAVYCRAEKGKQIIIAELIFILYSGLDILGAALNGRLAYCLRPSFPHLEWWSKYQYSSTTACLFWVFNQSVIPWVITLLFLLEETPRYYGILITLCFFCGPFPAVGLAVLMAVRLIVYLAGEVKQKIPAAAVLRTVFSFPNVAGVLLCMPVLAVFYFGNNALRESSLTEQEAGILSSGYWNTRLVLFLIIEVGIYAALLWKEHRKDSLYYASLLLLAIIPAIHIGDGADFCMRASIPAVFLIMLYCIQSVLTYSDQGHSVNSAKKIRKLLLVICLAVGSVTPAVEIYRGISSVVNAGTVFLEFDKWKSLEFTELNKIYESSDYVNTLFFRYFAAR